MKKLRNLKNERGITLVALVVTIVTLLILATVTINLVINDGLIGYAGKAKSETIKEQEKETISFALVEWRLSENVSFVDFFKTKFGATNVAEIDENTITVTIEKTGNKYRVSKNGNIEYVDIEEEPEIDPSEIAISLNKESIILAEEDTYELEATLTVEGNIEWESSDNTKATVDKQESNNKKANITAIAETNAVTITAKYTYKGEEYKANCIVKIVPKGTETAETVANARQSGKPYGQNTVIEDDDGNTLKIPKGFKVASDSATIVTKGVVIEDVTAGEDTVGSQFVWIPTGEVKYKENNQTKTKNVVFSRYKRTNNNGTYTVEDVGDNAIVGSTCTYQELSSSSLGNMVAKSITNFKTSVSTNGGYYIGRYEARDKAATNPRTSSSSTSNKVVLIKSKYVYNYISQTAAATLSRNMYGESDPFTSDLVNSYAWDTAIMFLEKFDDRLNQSVIYPWQYSYNSSFENKGTSSDKICNIYDMASNCREWTTETTNSSTYPAVHRSACCLEAPACARFCASVNGKMTSTHDSNFMYFSFRPIIYF